MGAKQEQKLLAGAQPFLEPDEEAVAAVVTQARGHSQRATSRGLAGGRSERENTAAASDAGFAVAFPMALVLTNRRLMSLRISTPIGLGLGGTVKSVISAVPLEKVDTIESHVAGIAKTLLVSIGGQSFKLESNVSANTKELAEAFAKLKP